MADSAFNDEENVNLYTNVPGREAGEGETLHYMSTEAMAAYGGAEGKTTIAGPGGQFGEIDTPAKPAAPGEAPAAAQSGKVNVGGQEREVTPQMINEMLKKKAMQEHEVDLDKPPEMQAEQRILKKIPELFQDTFQRPMQPNEVMSIDPKELKKFQGVLKDALKRETENIKFVQKKYETTEKNYTDFLFKDMKQQLDSLKTALNIRKEQRAEEAPKSEIGKMLIDKFGKEAYAKMSPEQKQAEYEKMLKGKEATKGMSLSPEAAKTQAQIAIANGGVIQGMGMGSPKARAQIIEAMEEMRKSGNLQVSDIVANAAIRKATTAELTKVQGLRGTVNVAMGAANKHGKTILELAEKIDNTGIPALQRWWNAGQKGIAGDKDVNNLNIAIHMYDTETARYLTTMTAGGQLSEREAERFRALLPPYASPDQITGGIETVGRLMDEKNQAFQAEVDDATTRIKAIGKIKGEPGTADKSNQPEFKEKITPKTPIQNIAARFTKGGMNRRDAFAAAKTLKRDSLFSALKTKNPKASDEELNAYIDEKYTDVKR
jgi:hypothetical protein